MKNDWLYDNMKGLKEMISFRDRTEFRVSGKLHNHTGPALILKYDPLHKSKPSEENSKSYYLNGIKMDEEQWQLNMRNYKVDKLIKKTQKD